MICRAHGADMKSLTTQEGFQDATVELSMYIAGSGTYVLEHSPNDCFFCIQGDGSLEKFLKATLKGAQLAS